jgi:hypothetical protein
MLLSRQLLCWLPCTSVRIQAKKSLWMEFFGPTGYETTHIIHDYYREAA